MITELAAQIGCCPSTIRRWVKRLGHPTLEQLQAVISVGKGSAGHWPKGRRRNPAGTWSSIRLRLQRLLDAAPTPNSDDARRRKCRRIDLAEAVNVHRDTITGWLTGKKVPAAETQAAIDQWVREAVKRLRTQSGQ